MENPVSKLARLDTREQQNESAPEELSAATPEGEPRSVGFTSAIGHLSLYGWLRWIHANRSDATLRVHTDDGSGNIWCSAGQIIDAEWEGRIAEGALAEMLPCSSGAVTIDFDPVQRPRRVATPTPQLLHVSEGDPTPDSAAPEQVAAAPSPQAGAPRKDRFAELALLLAESIAPVADSASAAPPGAGRLPPRKRAWRSSYVAGALVVAALAVAGFAVGRLRATSTVTHPSAAQPPPAPPSGPDPLPRPVPAASPSEQPVSPRPRELEPIPFVSIEVEPAHAEIWLDRELVGRGGLQLAAIDDGMLHELRFTAPGHESKTLFFRKSPPAGRVLLNLVAERDAPEPPRRVTRPRAAASAPSRARALATDPPAQAKPVRTPRVELIEVQAPRVQVLD